MKLLFITPGKLPVPATNGGAVETLIQTLIDNNEITKKYSITLVSVYTKEAYEASLKYKYTKFIFINIDDKLYKISRLIRYAINRIPNIYIGNEYIKRVYNYLKNHYEYYDYIIVENAPEYALRLCKLYKSNLIFHSHNDFLNENTDMAKKKLNKYCKVFSLSNYINKRMQDIDNNYKNIYTLYNGVELDKFKDAKKNRKDIRKKYNIKDSDFVYLYTGRIVEIKGVRELIKSFNSIKDDSSKLVIVGSLESNIFTPKSYIDELKDLSKNNKNIIFTGRVNYNDIPSYYGMADVGVVPSIWEEPFALTVIEHMGVGNPVIITNSGAMPELVKEGTSLIVEKDANIIDNISNAMINIKDNYKKYNSRTIIKQANKFNSNVYCDRFDELINK